MNSPTSASLLSARNVSKSFHDGDTSVSVLTDIQFDLQVGESVAIVGSSGAGKSTLLNILGGLEPPTSGSVTLAEQDIHRLNESARNRLRNQNLGFVYQFHHLLAEFDALENVAMPLLIGGVKRRQAQEQALDILSKVGLADRRSHRPGELSGGERQRVAIARALVNKPQCILMDEPTGNLDQQTAAKIQSIMMDLKREMNTSFVIVTHDMELASRMDRQLRLMSGVLKSDDSTGVGV